MGNVELRERNIAIREENIEIRQEIAEKLGPAHTITSVATEARDMSRSVADLTAAEPEASPQWPQPVHESSPALGIMRRQSLPTASIPASPMPKQRALRSNSVERVPITVVPQWAVPPHQHQRHSLN